MIIKSLLDNDFYTFTQMGFVLHNHPSALVRYSFKWRNLRDMHLRISTEDLCGRIKKELDSLCLLRFTTEELKYLASIPYFKQDFIEYLRLFQLNRSYAKVFISKNELNISIEGPWLNTIMFEIPTLAIVSQLYTENCDKVRLDWLLEGRKRLVEKLNMLKASLPKDNTFKFADFGTRRRADFDWHNEVIAMILSIAPENFIGTSNVYFAMKYGVKPIGTMSHSYIQAHQQLGPRLSDSQKAALESWAKEYRGELGIALSDCLGFKAFLKDFDRYFALLFDGCRHDSGDPNWWVENLIEHYKKLRINPMTKHAVFSDGLNFDVALDLYRKYHTQINTSFGIGTNLTNDVGFLAPQIVIKLVPVNGKPVAKISDSPGKGMCEDPEFLEYLTKVIREKNGG